ncbi:hypothetical protein H112_04987 [Trichophyton rubrum D6]|uniref:Zn(2)-C6 fungal-type domain-containing protein n=4 Tax=Trichophyton TaxID=5550 RepID=F2SKN6_TRIRC|nr:uncharacterized protein TERG_02755 [Trichophyton rubrum CBS 118892]EZF22068.1 hypothetical protein H100_05009 [Trichophyton rubrum MR850]EZF41111.1 hypothetical protein H102_04996 [Trichophyton rubrum CBS 100081]EZF51801.1 hypothetical protein H103_04997 [Trichophyton rubrum CBS 288.86]EZF62372.1 hypothetical protein H104_04990 [Trichophyton rubrum CBS 289.86]EZF73022.1 hypothetical protein H105_05015 [Trichophyton soudanense CBS 452.61]EZF83704.1 hypothetical protein H110_04995 [Trichophy
MSKRPRHIACRTCRERKIRCDGQQPCSRCAGQSQSCVYTTPSSSDAGTSDLTQQLQMMNDRLRRAEAQLANQACWAITEDPLATPGTYPYTSWPTNTIQSPIPLSPSSYMALPIDMESPQPEWALDTFAGLPPVTQPSSGSSTSSSFSIPHSNYEDRILSPQNMLKLQEAFFQSHSHLFPMLDQWRHLANPMVIQSEPWKSSIYYAICTHGALVSGNPSLEEACYHRARRELELSDMGGPGSQFFKIETLQASLLIALYEFRRSYLPRAWISHARCTRLVQLLGLQKLDRVCAPEEDEVELEEKRLTFWATYVFDCLINISFGGSLAFSEREISTRLPRYIHQSSDILPPQQTFTLSHLLQSPDLSPMTPYMATIIIVTTWAKTLKHARDADSFELDDQNRHQFWSSHQALDATINRVEACLGDLTQFTLLADPTVSFLNAARHAAAISLYQTAITAAVPARLPVALIESWQLRCQNSAMEIITLSGVMLEGNLLHNIKHFNPFIFLSIYTACAYLARVIRTGSPDSRILDPIESILRSFNRTEIKTANPTLDVFLPRIFKDIENTRTFPEPMIDPSLWLLNPGE